jgi:hypothetical protein
MGESEANSIVREIFDLKKIAHLTQIYRLKIGEDCKLRLWGAYGALFCLSLNLLMSRTIFYSSARCGSGKTHWAIKRLSERIGRTVFAVDRKEIASARAEAIRTSAEKAGFNPHVRVICSEDEQARNHRSVARRIEDAAVDLADDPHAVLIVCHAGLRLADLSAFSGWSLIIDEAMNLLEHRVEETGAMLAWLEANYQLGREQQVVNGHGSISSQVLPEPDGSYAIKFVGAFTMGDIAKRGSRDWLSFHQMVLTSHARCDVGSWREKARWSAWRRLDAGVHLAAFDEVFILADSFTDSETHLLMGCEPGLTFAEIAEIRVRDAAWCWRRRDARVEFFLDHRSVSDSLLKAPAFRRHLKAIGRHIAANSSEDDHLWSCNDAQAAALKACKIPGRKVQPVQAGANEHDQIATVSILYSAKPSPEAKVLYGRWGITEQQLIAAREFNAIRQFVMRSNARVPDSVRPLTFRVMDRAQAGDLERYLTAMYGFNVTLEHVDLGIEDVKPSPNVGGKAKPLSLEERRARQAGYARKSRLKAAGKVVVQSSSANLPP